MRARASTGSGQRLQRRGPWLLALLLAVLPVAPSLAQSPSLVDQPKVLEGAGSPFNLAAIQALLQKGDAAVSAGNLAEARRLYDQARDASRRLLGFYRDLSGSFRGLDARIPREMDEKGRETLGLLVEANLRLAALLRRQNKTEEEVPLLVEVVKTMTPASDPGRRAYQQLLELGFVSTPYNAPAPTGGAATGS
ncbi:MAG: hypothetical protein ACK550_04525 [Synechococcaceae cyanobacterium]